MKEWYSSCERENTINEVLFYISNFVCLEKVQRFSLIWQLPGRDMVSEKITGEVHLEEQVEDRI